MTFSCKPKCEHRKLEIAFETIITLSNYKRFRYFYRSNYPLQIQLSQIKTGIKPKMVKLETWLAYFPDKLRQVSTQ